MFEGIKTDDDISFLCYFSCKNTTISQSSFFSSGPASCQSIFSYIQTNYFPNSMARHVDCLDSILTSEVDHRLISQLLPDLGAKKYFHLTEPIVGRTDLITGRHLVQSPQEFIANRTTNDSHITS